MTEKELDKINLKIAEKLGWRSFRKENTPEPLNSKRMTGIPPGKENFRYQFVPAYTNNLFYAFKVLDKARKMGYTFRLTVDEDGTFLAEFKNKAGMVESQDWHILPSMAVSIAFARLK